MGDGVWGLFLTRHARLSNRAMYSHTALYVVLLFALVAAGCTAATPGTPLPAASASSTAVQATATITAPPADTAVPTVPASPTGVPTLAPTAVSTGTPPPAPSATPAPPGLAIIDYLRANVSSADPGATIRLEWSFSGAEAGALYPLPPSGQLGESINVGPSGTLSYTIPASYRNRMDFMLFVPDATGHVAQATLGITLRCPDPWFFASPPDECAAGPAVQTQAAEQAFERGTMLWVATENRIYVLYNDGQQYAWDSYTDEWHEGMPEIDPTLVPPDGLLQPRRGFGLVWREQPGVRDRLGWALRPEAGFTSQIQRTGRYKYNSTYLRAFGGGVWELGPERGSWRYLP